MKHDSLYIIMPAYNEEKNIPLTAARLTQILTEAQIAHELIFVAGTAAW